MQQVEFYYLSGDEMTREEYVEAILCKIGKPIFVKYYDDFKRLDPDLYNVIAEDYTEASKKRRTGYAISLIRQGLAEDALLNIARSKKIGGEYSALAGCIYSCEFKKYI